MTTVTSDANVYRGIPWQDLHPVGRMQFRALADALDTAYHAKRTKVWFRPHMGYRRPDLQDQLYAQGRTKPGDRVTNARGWESAHQFGLAVDFVPWTVVHVPKDAEGFADPNGVLGRFFWNDKADWSFLHAEAEKQGLSAPIKWDRPHIEHPDWIVLRERIRGG